MQCTNRHRVSAIGIKAKWKTIGKKGKKKEQRAEFIIYTILFHLIGDPPETMTILWAWHYRTDETEVVIRFNIVQVTC